MAKKLGSGQRQEPTKQLATTEPKLTLILVVRTVVRQKLRIMTVDAVRVLVFHGRLTP